MLTLPITKAKNEVIRDFSEFDILNDNFPLMRYKERLVNQEIKTYDLVYSLEAMRKIDNNLLQIQMSNRFKKNGFLVSEGTPVKEYFESQSEVGNDKMKPNETIMKYVDKIIELCEKENVELIFYRAPFVSTENELKQINYLNDYLEKKEIPFYDTEKEINFNINEDFVDKYHVSIKGANKITNFLGEKIVKLLTS